MSVSLTGNFFKNARGLTLADGGGVTWSLNKNTNTVSANASGGGAASGSPTAKVGLAAINGSAGTWMRSDAAPPIDQTITPTWTALHTFSTPPVLNGISWTAPTLLNSWAYFGSPFAQPGYYKDPTGRVFLRGLVKSGSSAGATIMTLPTGFRPLFTHIFAAVSNDLFCEVRVDTGGNVFATIGASTTYISLDQISFTTF